jgi:uncharacterized Zn-binding protein involved in type VI secretion
LREAKLMFEQGRMGDLWLESTAEPGPVGVAIQGSATVLVNGKPALRVSDLALGTGGTNRQKILSGAPYVLINDLPPGRVGDPTAHVAGKGMVVQGSGNVLIGNATTPPKQFSLDALLATGASFVFSGPVSLSSILATIIAESLPWMLMRGIPKLVFGILGKAMMPWLDLLTKLLTAALYIAWHTVKIKGKTLADWANWYFKNHLDNLLDGQERLPWNACPVQTTPNVVLPVYPSLSELETLYEHLKDGELSADDRTLADRLLHYFQPIEYQFADDFLPISVGNLLRHSTFVGNEQPEEVPSMGSELEVLQRWDALQGDEKTVDIDDDFARGKIHRTTYPAVVYGSVSLPKPSNSDTDGVNSISLSYKHCRAGSYMPTKRLEDLAFFHEFDGESIELVVNVVDGSIDRTRTGGHGYRFPCKTVIYRELALDPNHVPDPKQPPVPPSRACIFIAMGSHAISPTPGPRQARHGKGDDTKDTDIDTVSGGGVTDWYPPQQSGNGVLELLPALTTPLDAEHTLALKLSGQFKE